MVVQQNIVQRVAALDFTKGALVLLMVLYHWTEYFFGPQHALILYLRFLTPSFILITGFLISHMYLNRYDLMDPALPRRLAQRGIKILGLFLFLNAVITLMPSHSHLGWKAFDPFSVKNLIAIYVSGNAVVPGIGKVASFIILIPISYLLLLSAALITVSQKYAADTPGERMSFLKHTFHVLLAATLLSIAVLYFYDSESGNLEVLSFGLLGVVIGYVPLWKVNQLVRRPFLIFAAYLGYLIVITIFNVRFPIEVIGVCLNVLVLYLLGSVNGAYRLREIIMLLGRYSLFTYISQIIIIQALVAVLRSMAADEIRLVASLVGSVSLTILTAQVVEWVRSRSSIGEKMYRSVFA